MDNSKSYDRSAILSPTHTHKDYNRLKYYSALKTGYKHIGSDSEFLTPPVHVIDQNLFLLQLPFAKPGMKHFNIFLIIFYLFSGAWRETKFNGHYIQLLEDYDWNSCGLFAMGFPRVWNAAWFYHYFHKFHGFILHMQVDY